MRALFFAILCVAAQPAWAQEQFADGLSQPEYDALVREIYGSRQAPSIEVMNAIFRNEFETALNLLERETDACEAANPEGDSCFALWNEIAEIAAILDSDARALVAAESAYAIARRSLPASDRDTIDSLNRFTMLLSKRGDANAAERVLAEALPGLEAALPQDDPFLQSVYLNRATLLLDQRRYAEAEAQLKTLLDIQRRVLPEGDWMIVTTAQYLARAIDAQDRFAEATPYFREVAERRATFTGDRRITMTSYTDLAYNLGAQERYEEAEHYLRKARALYAQDEFIIDAEPIWADWRLADLLFHTDKSLPEVRRLFREAERKVANRLDLFRSFDSNARERLDDYGPIFIGQVATNWKLANDKAATTAD